MLDQQYNNILPVLDTSVYMYVLVVMVSFYMQTLIIYYQIEY